MICSPFFYFSSAGNTTLLVERREALAGCLEALPAEQAGFADIESNSLRMSGGEFCANACLAFAAYLSISGRQPQWMVIAGKKVEINCHGKSPHWTATARFCLDEAHLEELNGVKIAHLSGISHALIEADVFPEPMAAHKTANLLIKSTGLEQLEAVGVVWWRKIEGGVEIMPWVSVPKAKTCNIEAACGSGSLAVAMLHGCARQAIRQPSGKTLIVEICEGAAALTGPVDLLAEGKLWA